MAEDKLIPEENCRAAAYYAMRCIQDYINDIRASCYPNTPEEYGGEVYTMFETHLEAVERLLNGDSIEEVVAAIKIRNENNEKV